MRFRLPVVFRLSFIYLFILLPFQSYGELGNPEAIKPNALFDKDGNVLPEDPNNPEVNWTRIGRAGNARYRNVGTLEGGGSGCTTTIFQIPGCKDPNKKAQILTNGHCVQSKNSRSATFDMFHDAEASQRFTADASKTVYSSYNRLDIAVIELDKSYADLKNLGIEPARLSSTPLRRNKAYELVSVPRQGMKSPLALYSSECKIGPTETLMDNIHTWAYSVELDRCSAVPGSSGSALFRNGEITGLINAGNFNKESHKHPCELGSCTFDAQGRVSHNIKNYGFDVSFLHKCYEGCHLDIHLPGCKLPDPDEEIKTYMDVPYHSTPPWVASLNQKFVINSKFKSYKVKVCSQGDANCSCNELSGYDQAFEGKTWQPSQFLPNEEVKATLGQPPKLHIFCFRGMLEDGSISDAEQATGIPVYHYKRPPMLIGQ